MTDRRRDKKLLTKIGDAVETAAEKAQEAGTAVEEKARAARAKVRRKAKAVQADAEVALRQVKRSVARKRKAVKTGAAETLGKAKRAVARGARTAAAGAQKAAGKVERAMSTKRAAPKRRSGAAKKATGRTFSVQSTLTKAVASVRKVVEQAGSALRPAKKAPTKRAAGARAKRAVRQ